MSSLDNYLNRLEKKHVGETKKQKNVRRSKEITVKSAMQAEKQLKKAATSVRKRNTPENRARVKKYSTSFYNYLKKI
jgi:hypothetical protein